jgi:hypothetical protein
MIDPGLARLAKAIQKARDGAPSKDAGPSRQAVTAALRDRPRVLLGAWDALRIRGRQPAHRELHAIRWARAVVDAALAVLTIDATMVRGHRLPALALTAYGRSEDRIRVLAAGFDLHRRDASLPTALLSDAFRLRAIGSTPSSRTVRIVAIWKDISESSPIGQWWVRFGNFANSRLSRRTSSIAASAVFQIGALDHLLRPRQDGLETSSGELAEGGPSNSP